MLVEKKSPAISKNEKSEKSKNGIKYDFTTRPDPLLKKKSRRQPKKIEEITSQKVKKMSKT